MRMKIIQFDKITILKKYSKYSKIRIQHFNFNFILAVAAKPLNFHLPQPNVSWRHFPS